MDIAPTLDVRKEDEIEADDPVIDRFCVPLQELRERTNEVPTPRNRSMCFAKAANAPPWPHRIWLRAAETICR